MVKELLNTVNRRLSQYHPVNSCYDLRREHAPV